MLPVAILAGGLATRLRPLTEKIPKSLVDVGGEPFAYHQLRLLVRNGIERVVFCVGYLGEQVEAAIGDGHRFGLHVDYSFDGETLLGTAGAIARALPLLEENFVILYGDSYLDCDYRAVVQAYQQAGAPALMTVMSNDDRWDTSNVEFNSGRIVAYSKTRRSPRMRHIDYGLGVVRRSLFEGVPGGVATDLAILYERWAQAGQLAAFEVHQRFYEVGSFRGCAELESYLRQGAD